MKRNPEAGPRKGLLGGTFNPPHIAHLIVAHVVREALALEGILLVPTSRHAFKGDSEATPQQRATMTELATAGDRWLETDRLEVTRGGVSYTVDTLRELRQREPETTWHLIIGQDNLPELHKWQEMERLPGLAEIVVTTRGESDLGEYARPVLPFQGRCAFVPVPALEISSTAIRRRVADGRSIRYWVPPAVEAYIDEHGLYGNGSGAVDIGTKNA